MYILLLYKNNCTYIVSDSRYSSGGLVEIIIFFFNDSGEGNTFNTDSRQNNISPNVSVTIYRISILKIKDL